MQLLHWPALPAFGILNTGRTADCDKQGIVELLRSGDVVTLDRTFRSLLSGTAAPAVARVPGKKTQSTPFVDRVSSSYTRPMNLKEAVAVARQQINDLFAADAPQNVRLEAFLYDDHLMVWSLTIGFALARNAGDPHLKARRYKIVRVSEADKSVLSIRDQ